MPFSLRESCLWRLLWRRSINVRPLVCRWDSIHFKSRKLLFIYTDERERENVLSVRQVCLFNSYRDEREREIWWHLNQMDGPTRNDSSSLRVYEVPTRALPIYWRRVVYKVRLPIMEEAGGAPFKVRDTKKTGREEEERWALMQSAFRFSRLPSV